MVDFGHFGKVSNSQKLFLIGAPQVLRYSVAKEVEAVSGRDVRLEMEVCSDPIPSKTTWDWGSLRVEAGQVWNEKYLFLGFMQCCQKNVIFPLIKGKIFQLNGVFCQ